MAGGIAVAIGALANYLADPERGTVGGHWLVLVAHAALVFFFVGVLIEYGEQARPVFSWGAVLAVVGSVLLAGLVALELAVAADTIPSLDAVEETGALAPLTIVGPLFQLVGLLMLSVAGLRAKILVAPGWAAIIAGGILAFGYLAGADVLFAIGAVVTGVGLVLLGSSLASSDRTRRVAT